MWRGVPAVLVGVFLGGGPASFVLEKPAMPFCTQRRVEFCQTDAAGIVHFAAFFPMMESAEHEMLRSIGLSVLPPRDVANRVTWPRVAAHCDYANAAQFEDVLDIAVSVERIGNSSIQYQFVFTREKTVIAKGNMTAVCCRLSESKLEKIEIPEDVRTSLAAFMSAKHQG